MRVAIIGSGISGLVAAHELQREHDITVFEANDYIGGHTHTVVIDDGGSPLAVDTGFIVFNEGNYPGFSRLLTELGVASHQSDMSFAVNSEITGLEYRASSLDTLFAQRRNLFRPRIYRMIWDIFRFFREAPALLRSDAEEQTDPARRDKLGSRGIQALESTVDEELTLGEYLTREGYSDVFVEEHILPMGAALWSATRNGIREFPAKYFVRFLDNHGMLARSGRPSWKVVTGGSARYVEAITLPFRDRIRLRTPVERLNRDGDGVTVWLPDGSSERFDHVVVAVHSDQALALLADPTPFESTVLGSIPFQENDVVLHTDTSLLPRARKAWAAWNHHILAGSDGDVAVSYWMNRLQGFSASRDYLVTLNATGRIDPSKILARFTYHHPVFTPEGVARQKYQVAVGRGLHTTYCGAYWGFGFHEDGVTSGQSAAEEVRAVARHHDPKAQDLRSEILATNAVRSSR